MIKTVLSRTPFIDVLREVAAQSNQQAALAGGKFKNDFGNVLYLTNNRIRANQLNNRLARELADTAEKTIIPPAIMPYTVGFIHLAALVNFGYVPALNVCRYHDEWFQMFLCEIAKEIIPDAFFADEAGMVENQRANLAKDFQVFIRDAVLHLKTDNPLLTVPVADGDQTVKGIFLGAYQRYREKEKEFKEQNRFIHPLQAYEALYRAVCAQGEKPVNKVIVAENDDLLEPLFAEVLQKINAPVFIVRDPETEKNAYIPKTDVYHFMTPLDEAEFVGWKIKDLMARQKIPAADIAVVCANAKSKEVLEAVFKRMDIAGEQTLPMTANAYYRLAKMLFGVINNLPDTDFRFEAVFEDEKSKFKLGKGRFKFRKMFAAQGLKAQLSLKKALSESAQDFVTKYAQDKDYGPSAAVLKTFVTLLSREKCSACEIADRALNDNNDKNIIHDIMTALYELDELLKPDTDPDTYAQKARAFFSVLDGKELNAPRTALALEQAEAETEYIAQRSYSFSVAPLEATATLRAKYLLLCGFNASSDKMQLLRYPDALAKELGLQTLEQKKQRSAQSVVRAMNYAEHVAVSYPYMSMECKEDGQAVFIQLLNQLLPPAQHHKGKNGLLLKSYDVINGMPDPSWTGTAQAAEEEKGLDDFTRQILFRGEKPHEEETCRALLMRVLKPNEKSRYGIAAKDFVSFIICPSKFFFSLLAKFSEIETADEESVRRMTKGSFWHKVFEDAAAKEDFYSAEPDKIKAVLSAALRPVTEEVDIGKFYANDEASFLQEAEAEVLSVFAPNEAARQRKYGVEKNKGLEESFRIEIPRCDFDISGKVDRKDLCRDGKIIFWDYKSGESKGGEIGFYKGQTKKSLIADPNALQLALYMYAYAKTRKAADKEVPALTAGNIFLDGKDNTGPSARYDAKLEELLDEGLDAFTKMLKMPLSQIVPVYDTETCKYCNFKQICRLVSK